MDVSIIIPVFNEGKCLKRVLKSALRQTCSVEIICIDDGSTDGSTAILQKYSDRYPNIKVMWQEHSGAGAARNLGIAKATCEYIAFLDADDRYPNNRSLGILAGYAFDNGLDICGGLRTINIDGHRSESDTNRQECVGFPQGRTLDYRDTQIDYDYSNFIFRRDFLLEHSLGFPDHARYQDVPFFVKAMHTAGRYGVVPVCCYEYYISSKNPVRYEGDNFRGLLDGMLEVLGFAKEHDYDELLKRTLQRLDREYLPLVPESVVEESLPLLQKIDMYR